MDDPRQESKTLYPLTDALVIAVCAAIAGAKSYEDIVLYGRSKKDWLAAFLNLEHGIPSHDTFRRVFGLIDAMRSRRALRRGPPHRFSEGRSL